MYYMEIHRGSFEGKQSDYTPKINDVDEFDQTDDYCPSFIMSAETPVAIAYDVITKILEADADAQSNLVDPNIYMVILATTSLSLGFEGKLLGLNDLTRDIRISEAEGYLYRGSLPYFPLQGLLNKSDIIYKVRDSNLSPDWKTVTPLGTYEGQISIYDALKEIKSENVDILVKKYAAGGWYATPITYSGLKLANYVGNWWTWYFNGFLDPNNPQIGYINEQYMQNIVTGLFTKNIQSPNSKYFIPLSTTSLRSNTLPNAEQIFIDSIIKEGIKTLRAYSNKMTKDFKITSQSPKLYLTS